MASRRESDTTESAILAIMQQLAGSESAAALTDASVASATGASQIIAAADTTRRVLNISNPGSASWWINESGAPAVANGAGCFELAAGDRWTPRPAPTNAVTGIGASSSALSVVVG